MHYCASFSNSAKSRNLTVKQTDRELLVLGNVHRR